MKKVVLVSACALLGLTALYATDGDELIGVGPCSRTMGGVGIASSSDAVTSIFGNPATLTTLNGFRFDFASTILMPRVRARVASPPPPAGVGNWSGESRHDYFPIPAIGLRVPVSEDWCFGLGALGIAGMGVDYRNQDPMGTNTNLSILQIVPALAFKHKNLSFGAGLDMDYQAADFGGGNSHDFGLGAQLGTLYETGEFAFGAVYRTAQPITHRRISDFDLNGSFDDLELMLPQKAGFGVAYKPSSRFRIETDAQWIDWAGADGYKDFDWKSQWVFAVGAEYEVNKKLKLRMGYNYGRNAVKDHDGWNPAGTTNVQGTQMSTFGYEYFRIVGFPAIVEHHVTLGLGCRLSDNFSLNMGLVHGLRNSIDETSAGGAVKLHSSLSETFLELGFSWVF